MNQNDRSNLEFLRAMSDEALLDWYQQASEDDIAYAEELLDAWETELLTQEYKDLGFLVVDIPTVLQ